MGRLAKLAYSLPIEASTVRTARLLTILLILLCVLVAVVGLLVPGFYRDSPSSIALEHGSDLAALEPRRYRRATAQVVTLGMPAAEHSYEASPRV